MNLISYANETKKKILIIIFSLYDTSTTVKSADSYTTNIHLK